MKTKNPSVQQNPDNPVEHNILADAMDFWRGSYPEGMTADDVKKELTDFHYVIENATKVYCHVTRHRLSKLIYPADTVIAEFEQYVTDLCQNDVKKATEELRTQLTAAEAQLAVAVRMLEAFEDAVPSEDTRGWAASALQEIKALAALPAGGVVDNDKLKSALTLASIALEERRSYLKRNFNEDKLPSDEAELLRWVESEIARLTPAPEQGKEGGK